MTVVVLGAGVCGLYGALELVRQGKQVVLLEKCEYVGGLAAGHKIGQNFFDFGVHMLHAFDQEVFEDIKRLMGEERTELPAEEEEEELRLKMTLNIPRGEFRLLTASFSRLGKLGEEISASMRNTVWLQQHSSVWNVVSGFRMKVALFLLLLP